MPRIWCPTPQPRESGYTNSSRGIPNKTTLDNISNKPRISLPALRYGLHACMHPASQPASRAGLSSVDCIRDNHPPSQSAPTADGQRGIPFLSFSFLEKYLLEEGGGSWRRISPLQDPPLVMKRLPGCRWGSVLETKTRRDNHKQLWFFPLWPKTTTTNPAEYEGGGVASEHIGSRRIQH